MSRLSRAVLVIGSTVVAGGILWRAGWGDNTLVENQLPRERILPEAVTIAFGGDLMFDREIRRAIIRNGEGAILADVVPLLESSDFAIANLEGPISTFPSQSINTIPGESDNFVFTFDPSVAGLLAKSRINAVSIGNNHILNFGTEGLRQTRENLGRSGVRWLGDPHDERFRVLTVTIRDVSFAFVPFNEFLGDPRKNAEKTLDHVRAYARENARVIVFAHWGTEYARAPEERVRALAHVFVDAGAELVIGTHPHVVQPSEEYRGRSIYYSLGNFVFDQYFSDLTMRGLLVRATFHPDGAITILEFPIRMLRSGQTILVRGGPIPERASP